MYKLKFTPTAKKNFKKLDKRYKSAVSKALSKLGNNPKIGSPLKGELKGYWKLRFSRYRIVYQIHKRQLVIVIFDIVHRKEVYRN
jgi:mRNA interferase RelE/StbE